MRSQLASTGTLQLPTWLDLVLTPRSKLESAEAMRRARLFLVILLAGVIVSIVIFATGLVLSRPVFGFVIGIVGFALGYVIGRFISFDLCKIYTITLMSSGTYFILLLSPEAYSPPITFISVIIAALMALLLVRIQIVLAVVLVNLMALLILPFMDHQATDLAAYLTLMGGISLVSLLIMIIGYLSESGIERAAQSVEAIQTISDQYRRLLDASPDMMAVHANGRFLYINAAGMRLLGAMQTDEIMGQDVRQFMPENNRSMVAAKSRPLNADNSLSVNYQQTFQRIDRRLVETDVTVSPIQFESELATLIVARDRRPSSETPSQNEFPLDRLMDRLPVPVIVTQGQNLLYANHYIEALTGYTPAELKRLAWSNVATDVQTRPLDDSFAGRIQESEVSVKHKSGQTRTLVLRTQTQEYRGQRLSVSIGYDPRQTTRWTEQDIWMLETAFANYPEGLVYLDTDVRNGPSIISANRVFSHTSGYPPDELKGRTLHFLLGTNGEASAADLVRQALAQGDTFRGPIVYQRKDTTSARVLWVVRPIRDDRGQLLFAILHQRPQEPVAPTASPLLDETKSLILDLMEGFGFVLEMTPDNQLSLIWANNTLRALQKWTETPEIHAWEDLIDAADLISVAPFTYESLQDSPPRTVELRLRAPKSDRVPWIQMTIHPRPSPDSVETLRLYCVAQDISDRIAAEDAIKVHLVQQSVVMELGLLAIAAEDFKSLVEQVVLLCEQVVPDGICVAAQYLPHKKQLVVVGRGTSSIVPPVIQFDMRAVTGYTAETSLPLLIEDYATEERFHEPIWLPSGRVRSALSVAIPGHLHVYGVLTLFHSQPNRFTEDDIYFIQSIANVLAAFAERERMQTVENEQRDFLKVIADVTTLVNTSTALPDVLRITQEFIASVVPTTHRSSITLIDNDGTARIVSQRGFDEVEKELFDYVYQIDKMPLIQKMLRQRQPRLINDVSRDEEWRTSGYINDVISYLGAPILVEDRLIGIINLSSIAKDAFTPVDVERLMIFAGKIGTAIRNARYARDLETRIDERTLELSRQTNQLHAILESTGEGIFYTENRKIVFANQALARLTGYTIEEMVQQDATNFYPEEMTERENTLVTNMVAEISQGRVWRNSMRVRRKDGSTFYAGLTISRVHDNTDTLQRSVVIMRDMEADRRLEEQKSRFITNAAHDLRSPISNLNMRLYLMRRSPHKVEEHMHIIERVIERMNRLVNDLLDMSYFEYGHVLLHKQSLVLQETLLKAIEFAQAEADEKSVTLSCDTPTQPLTLLADPHRLEQVFVTLVTFALQYTNTGDNLTVSALIEHTLDHVLVVIEDNGRGIPPEHVTHLFEPFYRLDVLQPGSGLGLTLAQEIVTLHNGTLEVSSTLGVGTRFIIRLPLDEMGREA